jgi:transposase
MPATKTPPGGWPTCSPSEARSRRLNSRLLEPEQATRAALRALARRIQQLNDEIRIADPRLSGAVRTVAPRTVALFGAGTHSAGQLPVTAGDNPERLRSGQPSLTSAAPPFTRQFRSCRSAPTQPRRGPRRQQRALHHCIDPHALRPGHPHYVDRRTNQGLSKKEILRCLKRYVAREAHATLRADLAALGT